MKLYVNNTAVCHLTLYQEKKNQVNICLIFDGDVEEHIRFAHMYKRDRRI